MRELIETRPKPILPTRHPKRIFIRAGIIQRKISKTMTQGCARATPKTTQFRTIVNNARGIPTTMVRIELVNARAVLKVWLQRPASRLGKPRGLANRNRSTSEM